MQCAGLKDRYSHVYVISGEPESGAVADSGMDTVYHKDNKIQMDVKMPEELDGIAAWIPYAQEFVSSIHMNIYLNNRVLEKYVSVKGKIINCHAGL